MGLSVIILAAGQGTRMCSSLPKVLHEMAGKSLLAWTVETAEQLNPENIYVVYGHGGDQVKAAMDDGHTITWVEQKEQLGTGHAVMQVLPQINEDDQVLILVGDTPLINVSTLSALVKIASKEAIALLTVNFDDPAGLGRIIRDDNNNVIAITEEKDATDEEKQIQEINTGIMVVPGKDLKNWLPALKAHNAQGEYYLTDIMAMAVANNQAINTCQPSDSNEVLSVNDRKQLAYLERAYQKKKAEELMLAGVTLRDPARFDVRGKLSCGDDVVIDVNVIIEGDVTIGNNVTIGPNVILCDTTIADDVKIKSNCDIDSAKIGKACQIGPFARIRPGTELADNVKLGNFVETKNAKISDGSKVNHLSYIGDTELGSNVNIGAGTITCNYDGVNKHKTIIEAGAFIGSNSQLIAPVTIGKGAYIGSGSTISKDAPEGKLTLSRAKQQTIKGWKPPKKN